MALTLLVPDLLPPADAPEALCATRLPELERWLARADVTREAARGAEGWLARACGLESALGHAAISLAGEGVAAHGAWLHADPVHLRVQRDNVGLHDPAVLGLQAEETTVLVAALQALFASDGLRFIAPAADRWYVQVPEGEVPEAAPLEAVSGRNHFGHLPQGHGRINWRSALTEAQMLLANHPVNAARTARGMPEVNGVWFWGGGPAPASVAMPFSAILAASPFARGLARLAGKGNGPVPAAPKDVAAETLVILAELSAPLRRAEIAAWQERAAHLDATWFASLDALAARTGPVRVVLPCATDTVVATAGAGGLWRRFRSRKPVAAYA